MSRLAMSLSGSPNNLTSPGVAVKSESKKRDRSDDRLPVRWALILLAAALAGIGGRDIGGIVAGWGLRSRPRPS
jgi:hypothetical protein